jgi:hypothetical protein
MSMVIQLIKALTPHIRSQKDLDEAYLSESTDSCDLERRMREIDKRSQEPPRGSAYGSNWS